MSFMVWMSWMPMRSTRKPSIWYSSTQYFIDSSMKSCINGLSLAVSLPQPDPLEGVPSAL